MAVVIQANLSGNLAAALGAAADAASQLRGALGGMANVAAKASNAIAAQSQAAKAQKDDLSVLADQLREYGASEDQVKAALEQVKAAAASTGKPIKVLADGFSNLVQETEDVDKSLRHYGESLKFAERTGHRFSVSAERIAETLRGEMDVFSNFGEEGARIAQRLEQISDPVERGRQGLAALQGILARQPSVMDRMNASITSGIAGLEGFIQRLGPLGVGLGIVGGAALATGAALLGAFGAGLGSVIGAAVEKNKQLGSSVARLGQEWDKLKASIGLALLGGGRQAAGQVSVLTGKLQEVTAWVERNAESFRSGWTGAVSLAAGAAKFLNGQIVGVGLVLGALVDLVAVPVRLMGAFAKAGAQVVLVLAKLQLGVQEWGLKVSGIGDALQRMSVGAQIAFGALRRAVEEFFARSSTATNDTVERIKATLSGWWEATRQGLLLRLLPAIEFVRGAFRSLGETLGRIWEFTADALGLDELAGKARAALQDLQNIGAGLGQDIKNIFSDSATAKVASWGVEVDKGIGALEGFATSGGKATKVLGELGEGGGAALDKLDERLSKYTDGLTRVRELGRLVREGGLSEIGTALTREREQLALSADQWRFYGQELDQAKDPALIEEIGKRRRALFEEIATLREYIGTLERGQALASARERVAAARGEGDKAQGRGFASVFDLARGAVGRGVESGIKAKEREEKAITEANERIKKSYEDAGQAALGFAQSVLNSAGSVIGGAGSPESVRSAVGGGLPGLLQGALGVFGPAGALAGGFAGSILGGLFGAQDREQRDRFERATANLERAANSLQRQTERLNLVVNVTIPGVSFDRAVQASNTRNARERRL